MTKKIYQNHILCLYVYLIMYFQYGGCKWLLTFHIQHNYKMKRKKTQLSIIDTHSKMTHPQYKCPNKSFTN
jgi:hypothetical protein